MHNLAAFTDLSYHDGHPRCRVDLFRPANRIGAPLVLLIHGGGWTGGARTQYLPHCVRLAEAGFAAATIGYPLVPDAVWPELGLNVARAAAMLKARADEFGIDASRAVSWGSSAGGHLALILQACGPEWASEGRVGELPEIVGTLAQCPAVKIPLTDPPKPHHEQIANGHPPEAYSPRDMDPKRFTYVLAQHGDADELIPLPVVEEFVQHLAAHGVDAKLDVLPGAKHGYGYNLANEHAQRGLELGMAYVRQRLA